MFPQVSTRTQPEQKIDRILLLKRTQMRRIKPPILNISDDLNFSLNTTKYQSILGDYCKLGTTKDGKKYLHPKRDRTQSIGQPALNGLIKVVVYDQVPNYLFSPQKKVIIRESLNEKVKGYLKKNTVRSRLFSHNDINLDVSNLFRQEYQDYSLLLRPRFLDNK